MSSNKDDRPSDNRRKTERRRAPWPTKDPDDAKTLHVESVQGRLDSRIGFDPKGDPVLEWSLPARRASDNEQAFLKHLENRALRIEEESWISKSKRRSIGYNPYDKPPKG